MNRTARWVLAIVLLQTAAIGIYGSVEQQRAAHGGESLGTAPPQRVDMPMPTLTIQQRDGSKRVLAPTGRRALVHVWATWCPPCRAELPGLLELASQDRVEVIAIALDQRWDHVERFLGDVEASDVVLAASGDVEGALGVKTLPVTFLLEEDGRISLRFEGARNWSDETFVQTHLRPRSDVP